MGVEGRDRLEVEVRLITWRDGLEAEARRSRGRGEDKARAKAGDVGFEDDNSVKRGRFVAGMRRNR
jgi:hypothetical protein